MIPYDAVDEDENPEDSDAYCGDDLTSEDGYCDNTPSYSDDRCGRHTETLQRFGREDAPQSQIPDSGGHFPDSRSKYYEDLPDEEKAQVDGIINSFLEEAPFSADHRGKVEMLRQVAIDMHKRRLADQYISYEGMTQDVTGGYHEEFGPIQNPEENPLHLTADRITRTNAKVLKELGILGNSPEARQAEASEGILDVLSSNEDDDDVIDVESESA